MDDPAGTPVSRKSTRAELLSHPPLVPTAEKTGAYTAVSGDLVICDTSGGAFTVTLPAAPRKGDRVGVSLRLAGNNLTVGRNGNTIDGAAADLTLSAANTSRTVQYDGSGWRTTEASGLSVLASAFALTTTNTFQDTGLEVTLPAAGTWDLNFSPRAVVQVSGGDGWISVRLYDETAAAVVSDSTRLMYYVASGITDLKQLHVAFSHPVTVTAASTIRLEAVRGNGSGTPSWSLSQIDSNADGRTTLSYVRMSK